MVLVVLTTWLPKVRLEGVSETPGAIPMPLRATVCVPPEALSVIVTVPLRMPVVVGVNVTTIAQVLADATAARVEQVVEGSKAKSPLMASAVKFRLLVPSLVRVTDAVPLVFPTTSLPKVRLEEGEKETPGAVPVPVKATLLLPALVEMLRLPVRVPVAVGVKTTPTWQEFVVSEVEVEQVVVVGSTAKSPLTAGAAGNVRLLAPGLLTVTVSAPLLFPTSSLPKVSVEVEKPSAGAIPVPESATACVLPATPLLLSMIVTAPVLVPREVGEKVTQMVQLPPPAWELPQLLV